MEDEAKGAIVPAAGPTSTPANWASKVQHAVQDVGSDGHFGRLLPVCLQAQLVADDAFSSR